MLTNLRNKLFRRLHTRMIGRQIDFQEMSCFVARQRLGESTGDEHIDEDAIIDQVEAMGLTMADFEANVELAEKRIKWAKLAVNESQLRTEAARLDAECTAMGAAEQTRREEFKREIDAKRLALYTAQNKAIQALSAVSDLEATAAPAEDAGELLVQQAELNRRIAAVEEQLVEGNHAGGGWGSVERQPALFIRQAKSELATPNLPVEKRKRYESQIAAAEKVVAAETKKLAQLKKQQAALTAKLAANPEDRLRPENFTIVRRTKSRDQISKEHASRMGFGNEPTVSLLVG